MLTEEIKRKLNRNIHLFGVYKSFTKRVFLPIIAIYATQQAGLSVPQIGFTAAAASFVGLIFDSLTGYWADLYGRKKSAQIGSMLAAMSCVVYALSTNFYGILAAAVILGIGYAFMGGAMDALIHDSLTVLGQEDRYAKVASRAQAIGLVPNAIFVALTPLLYPIDKRLPFVAGIFAYLILFSLASFVTEPQIDHDPSTKEKNFLITVNKILTRKTWLFFFLVGIVYSLNTGFVDLQSLGYVKLGLKPEQVGMVFASSSLLGVIIGIWVHKLKALSFKTYATLDIFTSVCLFASFGLIRSLPVVIGVAVINMALWRYQRIMYQHHVLKIYGKHRYKATLLSLLDNSQSLSEIWVILLVTRVAGHVGVLSSLGYVLLLLAALWPMLLFSISQFSANAKAEAASATQ